jgi:hypothetical protein
MAATSLESQMDPTVEQLSETSDRPLAYVHRIQVHAEGFSRATNNACDSHTSRLCVQFLMLM